MVEHYQPHERNIDNVIIDQDVLSNQVGCVGEKSLVPIGGRPPPGCVHSFLYIQSCIGAGCHNVIVLPHIARVFSPFPLLCHDWTKHFNL